MDKKNTMSYEERTIRDAASMAWEQISSDAVGYEADGRGAVDWVEQVMWQMEYHIGDAELVARLRNGADAEIEGWVEDELKKYG